MFAISQVLTLGESDLRNLEIIYMSAPESVIYFITEALMIPWMIGPAIVFCSLFWWLYAAEFTYFWMDVIYTSLTMETVREDQEQYYE